MATITLKPHTTAFLAKVPQFPDFTSTANVSEYADVPKDWFLFVTDIRGSTKATEAGRYKDVNVVGASAVMAVLNQIKPHEVFYVFGGDGATFLSPPELADEITSALLAARVMAKRDFDFDLRVGKVPVWHLYAVNCDVKVVRFNVSRHVTQAALAGDGLSQAESWVKKPPPGENYEVMESDLAAQANTEGLECRWNPVDSQRGSITSLIVQSLNLDPARAENDYREILGLVDALFLNKERPIVSPEKMSMALNPKAYVAETISRTNGQSFWKRLWYGFKAYSVTVLFKFLWASLLKKSGDAYKNELVDNTDYRKFDGVLRMVLDLSPGQIKRLEGLLEAKSKLDEIVYGMHFSKTALMTCLVFDRAKGNHLHFVDGNDGGYSAAAKVLKKKIADRNELVCSVKPKRAGA